MYKSSIDIGSINKEMKVTFNIIISEENDINNQQKNANNFKTISRFIYNGADYLKFSPRPYLTIAMRRYGDVMSDKNCYININKLNLFVLIQRVKKMIENFKVEDLFFVKNKRLNLNVEKAQSLIQVMKTNDKSIAMVYCVIEDENNRDIQYEGISFMINDISHSTLITYDELLYMYHMLSTINMDVLSMELINAYLAIEKNDPTHTIEKNYVKSLMSECPNETPTNALPRIQQPNEIPNI